MSPFKKLTHQNKVWLAISSALVVLLAFSVVSTLAYKNSADATRRSALTAQCVNNVLALRQKPPTSKTDADATAEILSAMSDVLTAPKDKAADAYQQFLTILAKNKAILNANQAFRDAHPFGLC